ncbi:peptidoglycan DD-metalloendopeptidase family protein [Massilia sp. RP-1-19]|uniref:Peptidoglycan DD-metalloendopeptidase family protein n=1 Tax=Massilia polaris TaxID=2728846 RepID=A0A848HCK6_9BURK|nr:peptidoglycan DD-metalloendopeptidase family protein [Massilia polaris]NML59536.1 peptidoglycan DD-metalloendopeptidase family protein [Massilia polaris]
MKQKSQYALLSITIGLLSACTSTTRQAPVVERTQPAQVRPAAPAPQPAKEDRTSYTVQRGDTLLGIALDFGQNYRDLQAWNNLSDPNDIKYGQVLRVSPPAQMAQATPVAAPPETRQPAPPRKTAPRADKRPYTETAMADAQKSDGTNGRADPKPADRPEPAAPIAGATPAAPAIVPGATVTATDDDKLSWMWPSDGRIVATFDEGKNKGIDIAGRAGQHVMAAGAGKVMYAGSGIRGYGNLVIVKHSNSLLSAYAHNRSIVVKEGQNVNKGQVIAEMGDSDADSVKLHFEIRQQGKPVDPSKFLPIR